MFQKINKKIFLGITALILLLLIFRWVNYLFQNFYIQPINNKNKEGFYLGTSGAYNPNNVLLPLNTTTSCRNMCGPTARCAITGQQCLADNDCPGCTPYVPPLLPSNIANVWPQNDAGKLTVGMTPTYSELTTDIGTQAKFFEPANKLRPPPKANFGENTWITRFKQEEKMYNERYKPTGFKYMITFPDRYTDTGEFVYSGPLASNAYLS